MPLFCRHNRFEASCPICSKAKSPAAPPRPRTRAKAASGRAAAGGLKTRRLARAADDGYRHELIPGVRATADAERLAAAVGSALAALEGRAPATAEAAAAAAFGDAGKIAGWTPPNEDPNWTPERRFARWFDRLRLPGTTRAQRFAFLVALGQEPGQLFFDVKGDDAATLAAKRLLNSGDAMLLERRAAALAAAGGFPIAALDRALVLWDGEEALDAAPAHEGTRKALRLA